MNLHNKQLLCFDLSQVLYAYGRARGYRFVIGMGWRSREESKRLKAEGRGISPSLHEQCLAFHPEAFGPDGNYLEETADYRELGELWESLHPLCRWGGRFGDGGHFSMEHGGLK